MKLGLAGRLVIFGVLAALLVTGVGGWMLREAFHGAMWNGLAERVEAQADELATRFTDVSEEVGSGGWRYSESRFPDEFSRIFSGWYWQLRGENTLLRSRSLWDDEIQIDAVAPWRSNNAFGPQNTPLFGIVIPMTTSNGGEYQLEVFGSAATVIHELKRMDQLLWTAVVLLIIALILVTLLQGRLALSPLRRLRGVLDSVEGGNDQRIGVGYGPELDPLAMAIDRLLARNASVVSRARSHAADLAHALKKPLTLLGNDAAVAAHVSSVVVAEQVGDMTRMIDRHLARAGSGAGDYRRLRVETHVQRLLGLMRQLHSERQLQWQLQIDPGLTWRGEPSDLEEMLGNLLDNAGKWAASLVKVNIEAKEDAMHIHIEDDGCGLSDEQLQSAATRGKRFDESVEGSGLGLAITSDIAETYEGQLILGKSDLGGLSARLRLPN